MAITHNSDWMADDFGDAVSTIWNASTYGYGVVRWDDPMHLGYRYGLSRVVGPNQGKVPIGVFDTPQEVIAMVKLILASEEHDGRR